MDTEEGWEKQVRNIMKPCEELVGGQNVLEEVLDAVVGVARDELLPQPHVTRSKYMQMMLMWNTSMWRS